MSTNSSLPAWPPSSFRHRASTLLEQGNYELALREFYNLPEPEHSPDDWVNQAVCLIHLNQPEAAHDACDRALAINPDHPQAWLFKGVALQRLKRYDEAYTCYDQALGGRSSSAPQNPLAALGRRFRPLRTIIKQVKERSPLRLWVN